MERTVPLTALSPHEGTIDSTDLADSEWTALHRTRPRAELTCPACGRPMHAKVSSQGLRFFAHDRTSPECPSNGETPAHRELKRTLAEAVRRAGGVAIIEALPQQADEGGWRADVLAIAGDGRRIALEVQLSGMTVDEGRFRTKRYATDGVETVWVTNRRSPWFWRLPGLQVALHPQPVVTRGIAIGEAYRGACRCTYCAGSSRPRVSPRLRWSLHGPVDLYRVAGALLHGQLRAVEVTADWASGPVGGPPEATVWMKPAGARVADEVRAESARSRIDCATSAEPLTVHEPTTHVRSYTRDTGILAQAVEDAYRLCEGSEAVVVGTNRFPAPRNNCPGVAYVLPSRETGMGLPVWIRDEESERLFAIVCPRTEFISPELAYHWRRADVRIYRDRLAGGCPHVLVKRRWGWSR